MFEREKPDLLIALYCLFAIPLTWLVLLGWNSSYLIMGGDALHRSIAIRDFLAVGGAWSELLYRPGAIGGAKIVEIMALSPIYQLAALLDLTPQTAQNFAVFVVQFFYAFLGTLTIKNLVKIWSKGEAQTTRVSELALVLLLAFSPFIAWRLSAGHLSLIMGLLLFLGSLFAVTALRSQRLSLTASVVLALALICGYLNNGHQLKVYGAVFGFPILLGLLLPELHQTIKDKTWFRSEWKILISLLLIFVGAFLIIAPKFSALMAHAKSGDGARSLDGESVVYAYTTAEVGDWASSLTWSKDFIPESRNKFLHHEINYPLGALLLLCLFSLGLSVLAVQIGLLVGFIMAVCFSMNISPFSDLLMLIGPLNSFRVPARAMMPIALSVLILGSAVLLARQDRVHAALKGARIYFAALALLVAGFFLPGVVAEIITWFGLIYIVLQLRSGKALQIPLGFVLAFLAGVSLGAFKSRFDPFSSVNDYIIQPASNGTQLKAMYPELQNPFNRAQLVFNGGFQTNTAWAFGISSIDGYNNPTQRFLKLFAAVKSQKYNPTWVNFRTQPQDPGFSVIKKLYNICCIIAIKDGRPTIQRIGKSEPAWFSNRLQPANDYQQLAGSLRGQTSLDNLVYISSDAHNQKLQWPKDISDCSQAQVQEFLPSDKGQRVRLKVSSPDRCPLTVSMNYTSRHRSTLATGEKLSDFVAYGALYGIWVPEGDHDIFIDVLPHESSPSIAFLGLALLLGAFAIVPNQKRTRFNKATAGTASAEKKKVKNKNKKK